MGFLKRILEGSLKGILKGFLQGILTGIYSRRFKIWGLGLWVQDFGV